LTICLKVPVVILKGHARDYENLQGSNISWLIQSFRTFRVNEIVNFESCMKLHFYCYIIRTLPIVLQNKLVKCSVNTRKLLQLNPWKIHIFNITKWLTCNSPFACDWKVIVSFLFFFGTMNSCSSTRTNLQFSETSADGIRFDFISLDLHNWSLNWNLFNFLR
jgi:hypothetical protein